MFCSQCGNKITEGQKFCSFCGSKITSDIHVVSSVTKQQSAVTTINLESAIFYKRFINWLVDPILAGLSFIVVMLLGKWDLYDPNATFFLLIFCIVYYLVFETVWQKTPGKWVTKTKVVMCDGSKPDFWHILGRTFARFIPLDPISFLSKHPVGWHDKLSGTMVIDENKINNVKNQILKEVPKITDKSFNSLKTKKEEHILVILFFTVFVFIFILLFYFFSQNNQNSSVTNIQYELPIISMTSLGSISQVTNGKPIIDRNGNRCPKDSGVINGECISGYYYCEHYQGYFIMMSAERKLDWTGLFSAANEPICKCVDNSYDFKCSGTMCACVKKNITQKDCNIDECLGHLGCIKRPRNSHCKDDISIIYSWECDPGFEQNLFDDSDPCSPLQ